MQNPDEAKFPIAAASAALNRHVGTVRSWVQKGWIRLSRIDKAAKVPGATTLLSGRRVLQFEIAAAAVAIGVHPEIACSAARSFTDIGDETRAPGKLFEGSFTALVIYHDGTDAILRISDTYEKVRAQMYAALCAASAALHAPNDVVTETCSTVDAAIMAEQEAKDTGGSPLQDVFFPRDPVAHAKGSRREAASVLMLDLIVKRVEIALQQLDREFLLMRFRVEPRDVPAETAARRLGKSADDFSAALPNLVARGFPAADPDTGNFDLAAIDRWCDARNPHLFSPSAEMQARDASGVAKDRIAAMRRGGRSS